MHLWQSLFNTNNGVFFEAPVTRVRVPPPLKKTDIMDVGCPWTPSPYSTEDAWSRFALGESNAVQRWNHVTFTKRQAVWRLVLLKGRKCSGSSDIMATLTCMKSYHHTH